MSRQVGAGFRRVEGFPRVSGDEPHLNIPMYEVRVFSPRERG